MAREPVGAVSTRRAVSTEAIVLLTYWKLEERMNLMSDIFVSAWDWVSFFWRHLGEIVMLAVAVAAYFLGRRHGRRQSAR